MSKIFTLKKDGQFRYVFNKGRYKVGRLMVIYVTDLKRSRYNKLGISITKKFGNAVKRNRMRRLIKENYRLCLDRIRPGHNIVIAARNVDKVPSYFQVKKEMLYLLKKLDVLEADVLEADAECILDGGVRDEGVQDGGIRDGGIRDGGVQDGGVIAKQSVSDKD